MTSNVSDCKASPSGEASVALTAKSLQSCPTLGDPMDCSPPGSSVHGIFQASVLEWGAIAFSSVALRVIVKYILVVSPTYCHLG